MSFRGGQIVVWAAGWWVAFGLALTCLGIVDDWWHGLELWARWTVVGLLGTAALLLFAVGVGAIANLLVGRKERP